MHQVRSFFAPDRYSAKKTAVPINFVCVALDAKHVFLTGILMIGTRSPTP